MINYLLLKLAKACQIDQWLNGIFSDTLGKTQAEPGF
jgi:hypothetical protein